MCARSASRNRATDDLIPSSSLPLAYYLVGYAGFGAGLAVLAFEPSLAAASFYQPRFVALVHLLTLAWLAGSILGSLYIVGPLVLRVPMRVHKRDWIAFGAFVFGLSGMVAHFWINTYDGMAASAVFVLATIMFVGWRVLRGMRDANIRRGVGLHIALAFANLAIAAAVGIIIGLDRSRGFLAVSPLATMFAHIHLAAVGWVTMLVIGLSYRLIPMALPSVMPSGRSLALSAILLESGLAVLAVALMIESRLAWVGALLIVAGLLSFVAHVRMMLSRRLPRAHALPARDWSAWQIHMALAWLAGAAASGVVLSIGAPEGARLPLMWIYGVAGLVGFLAQMVAGMQGRIVPLYAWYRAFAAHRTPPPRAANALPSAMFARTIFACWTVAVPLLGLGLAGGNGAVIRAGALILLAGLGVGGAYMIWMIREASPTAARSIPHLFTRNQENQA